MTRKLRMLIREMIDEMAYGGTLSGINLKPSQDPSQDAWVGASEKHSSFDAIEKHHRAPIFDDQAKKRFAGFPYDVYVVPISTRINVSNDYGDRVVIMNPEAGLQWLEGLQVTKNDIKIDIDKIAEKLKSGATVIFSQVQSLSKGNLPTPWMLIHALFDSSGGPFEDQLVAVQIKIEKLHKLGITPEIVQKFATMKSARDGKINTFGDFCAELLTQAVATQTRVRFDKEKARAWVNSEDPEVVNLVKENPRIKKLPEKLKEIEDFINNKMNIHNDVIDALRNQVVIISTYILQ